MTGFRKFCTIVFFAASLLGVGALAGDYFGFQPVASVVEGCRDQAWFSYLLLALLAIFALGMVVLLLGTLFARGRGTYQEAANDFGSICISRSAIERAVQDVIETHSELHFMKASVKIVNRKKPYADITAKVAPRGFVSLAAVAPILQKEIKDAVETLTGNEVRAVVVDIRENKDAEDVMSLAEKAALHVRLHGEENSVPYEKFFDDGQIMSDDEQVSYDEGQDQTMPLPLEEEIVSSDPPSENTDKIPDHIEGETDVSGVESTAVLPLSPNSASLENGR